MERLEEIVEAEKFDVFEIFVHQLSVPLALTLAIVQSTSSVCLNLWDKEERVEMLILLNPERIEVGADCAD